MLWPVADLIASATGELERNGEEGKEEEIAFRNSGDDIESVS